MDETKKESLSEEQLEDVNGGIQTGKPVNHKITLHYYCDLSLSQDDWECHDPCSQFDLTYHYHRVKACPDPLGTNCYDCIHSRP